MTATNFEAGPVAEKDERPSVPGWDTPWLEFLMIVASHNVRHSNERFLVTTSVLTRYGAIRVKFTSTNFVTAGHPRPRCLPAVGSGPVVDDADRPRDRAMPPQLQRAASTTQRAPGLRNGNSNTVGETPKTRPIQAAAEQFAAGVGHFGAPEGTALSEFSSGEHTGDSAIRSCWKQRALHDQAKN